MQLQHAHLQPLGWSGLGRASVGTCTPLQVLHADVARLSSFGAARGIRHLMLQLYDVVPGVPLPDLSALEQLQTLWLSDTVGPRRQTTGALHLSALPALRRVMMDDIVPEHPDARELRARCAL